MASADAHWYGLISSHSPVFTFPLASTDLNRTASTTSLTLTPAAAAGPFGSTSPTTASTQYASPSPETGSGLFGSVTGSRSNR